MQAHQLSTTAARILSLSTAIETLAAPSTGPPPPSNLVPAVRQRRLSESSRPVVPAGPSLRLADGAGLAHDAGNLLGALGLYCDLLQARGVLRPEHQHYAVELRQLAERSGAMIRRLLEAEFGLQLRTHPDPAAVVCGDPAAALLDQAALLQRIAAPWATVSVETGDRLPALSFPVEVLERVTVNLVLNAAQAIRDSRFDGGRSPVAPEGCGPGAIRVSLAVVANRLRLTVEDDGPGVPPSIAAAFLRPSPMQPGTARGLGHRIVHELAEATGGSLFIRARPAKGTAFCLEWPVTNPPGSPHGKHDNILRRAGQAGSRPC